MTVTPLEQDQILDWQEGRADHVMAVEAYEHEADQLQAALVAALGELDNIAKDGTADAGTYRYSFATLAATMASIRPVLARHGLALTQPVTTSVEHRTVTITTTILHTAGGRFSAGKIELPLGQRIQDTGSVISYARRYAALAALGITGVDDDDDGHAANQAPTTPPPRPPRSVSAGQAKKIGALMDAAGLNRDDTARRDLVSGIIGRGIKTRNDLTDIEAGTVIAALQAVVDGHATIEISDDGTWTIIEA